MQDHAFQLRHVGMRHAFGIVEAFEIAEQIAERVAKLAIGLDIGFQDLIADGMIIPIIGR